MSRFYHAIRNVKKLASVHSTDISIQVPWTVQDWCRFTRYQHSYRPRSRGGSRRGRDRLSPLRHVPFLPH